jgi:hypothetical protein
MGLSIAARYELLHVLFFDKKNEKSRHDPLDLNYASAR